MNKPELMKHWLAGNAVVAFAGAVLMVRYSQLPHGSYELTSNVTIAALLQVSSVVLAVLLFTLSFCLVAAYFVNPLRSRAIRAIPGFSPILGLAASITFAVSWITAYVEVRQDELWQPVMLWGGFGMFLFISFTVTRRLLIGMRRQLCELWQRTNRSNPTNNTPSDNPNVSTSTTSTRQYPPRRTEAYIMSIKNRLVEHRSLLRLIRPTSIDGIMYFLASLAAYVAIISVLFWFVMYFTNIPNVSISGSPFTLAQVMAIFGGFGVAGGFSNYGDCRLRRELRLVGALHLLSALGFGLLGMISPMSIEAAALDISWSVPVFAILISASLIVALGGFSVGTMLWVGMLPKIVRFQSNANGDGDS